MGVPTQASEVEKRAMIGSAILAGAKKVHLIAEPMAAAIELRFIRKSRTSHKLKI